MKHSLLFLLALILCVESVRSACTYTSSDNKWYYDLSSLQKTSGVGYMGTSDDGYNYWFNVCGNLPQAQSNCTTQTTPVCQASIANKAQVVPTGLLPAVFSDGITGTDSGVTITYTNTVNSCSGGFPRITILYFKCVPGATLSVVGPVLENNPVKCTYDIYINSGAACPTSNSGKNKVVRDLKKISGGSVFLIIFFIGGAVYLIVGSVVKWRVQHQTGIEVIPNIEFWRNFSGLVKDGFIFTKNKVMGLTGRGYQAV